MAVISIGKFLSGKEAHHVHIALINLIHSMLETVANATIPYDEQRAQAFREEVVSLGSRIHNETEIESIPVVAELFSRAILENTRGIDRVIREQSEELRSMAKLITRALPALAADDEDSQNQLKDLQRELDLAQNLRDIVGFKARLKTSLESLQRDADQRRKRSAAVIDDLKRELEESRARLAQFRVDPTKDAVTGLPIREDAAQVLSFLAGKDGFAFAMVLSIQQLPSLNARFGHQVGSLILQNYVDYVEHRVSGSGRLFRWGGKCIVAIFSKAEISHEASRELIRALGTSANLDIDTGSRTVMVPISPKWLVVGRTETLSGPQVIERIDKFAADA